MEIARPQVDIETRFRTVKLTSVKCPISTAFILKVADVRVQVAFDSAWGTDVPELCQKYWAPFICERQSGEFNIGSPNGNTVGVEIVLSPAEGEFIHQENKIWNEQHSFQKRVDDPTGSWIFHRDFTCHLKGIRYHAWLPKPTPTFTDALDNILTVSVRQASEKHQGFLFHSAIVEHRGQAVVLFGPSGIGKSTVAKLSSDIGLRVMASDQAYLRIERSPEGARLWASASPTRNPDIPRNSTNWVTDSLLVKSILALKRTGRFEIQPMDRSEMTRRFFSEIFRDETDDDFGPALKFASDVAMLDKAMLGSAQPTHKMRLASLSYPFGFNFWPQIEKLGYI